MSNVQILPRRASSTTIWHNIQHVISNIWTLHFQFTNVTTSRFGRHNWTQHPKRKFQRVEIAFPTLILQCRAYGTTVGHNTKHVILNVWEFNFQPSSSTTSRVCRRDWTQHPTCNLEHMEFAYPTFRLERLASDATIGHHIQNAILNVWEFYVQQSNSTKPCFWHRN